MHFLRAVVLLGCCLPAAAAEQPLRFANIFGDGMVLQRDRPIAIWGWGDGELTITIAEGDKTLGSRTVRTDASGRWTARLDALPGSFASKTLTITAGDKRAALKQILIGEVWICSGQSNMAWGLRGDTMWALENKSANYPGIRHCALQQWTPEPLRDLSKRATWTPLAAGSRVLPRVSAIGYYFAVRLHRYLKVPVGIIQNASGGTRAETWTARATLEGLPEARDYLTHFELSVKQWPEEKLRRQNAYARRVEQSKKSGTKKPRAPRLGAGPIAERNQPSGCYNAMIAPLAWLSVRGAIFYQGENNAAGAWNLYRASFPAMIADWRKAFGQPKLPFGIISLAGFGKAQRDRNIEEEMVPPGRFWFAAIRDVHEKTHREDPHTGLIVTSDLGDSTNIHPQRKQEVGERAARWALAMVYGKRVPHTGPTYRSMKIVGERIRLSFDVDPTVAKNAPWFQTCPITRAGAYRGFVIAGADRRFYPASVRRLDRARQLDPPHQLELWSEFVNRPVAVRYAWAEFPDANVIGVDYLPMPGFRTDDWPLPPDAPADPRELHSATVEYCLPVNSTSARRVPYVSRLRRAARSSPPWPPREGPMSSVSLRVLCDAPGPRPRLTFEGWLFSMRLISAIASCLRVFVECRR